MRNVVNDDGARAIDASAADLDIASAEGLDIASAKGLDIDLAFLDAQTFGDRDLEREVLGLFVEQARRIVPSLPDLPAARQADAAHLLKGSARGIGAWAAAAIAEAYEQTEPAMRLAIHADLAVVFARAERAIEARLAMIAG